MTSADRSRDGSHEGAACARDDPGAQSAAEVAPAPLERTPAQGAPAAADAAPVAVSVVVPLLDESAIVRWTASSIAQALEGRVDRFEVVLVDDGSTDSTWAAIRALAAEFPFVTGVRLARNFGHDAALLAGLRVASGDLLVTMDCDGQHPFSLLPQMVERQRASGCDIVDAVKQDRGRERRSTRWGARAFGAFLSGAVGVELNNATEFKLLSRRVLPALMQCGDYHVFYRALVPWLGFHHETLLFDVPQGARGSSHWTLRSLVRFATSGLVMFSDLPIRARLWAGAIGTLACVAIFVKLLYGYLRGAVQEGYSTVLTLILLNLAFSLLSVGLLGVYVRATLSQSVRRPRVIITALSRGAGAERREVITL